MEPELPFWGTIAAKGEDGYNEEEQDYLINEGIRIIKDFSHHPSFVMMSLGNELWGSRERLGEIIDILRREIIQSSSQAAQTTSSSGLQKFRRRIFRRSKTFP